jgi:negative regulator of flagellin synthesis FlgM
MTSKIDALNVPRPPTGARPATAVATAAAGLGSGEPVRRVSGSDQLKLTDTAVLLARLEAELGAQDEIQLPRVDALRSALAEGRYQVRPEVITERLLGLERDLNALGHERPRPR